MHEPARHYNSAHKEWPRLSPFAVAVPQVRSWLDCPDDTAPMSVADKRSRHGVERRVYLRASTRTRSRPRSIKPSLAAAARETSMITPFLRAAITGPRSTIRSVTTRPFRRLVTRTLVPNG